MAHESSTFHPMPGVQVVITETPDGALVQVNHAPGMLLSSREASDMAREAVQEWRADLDYGAGRLVYLPSEMPFLFRWTSH